MTFTVHASVEDLPSAARAHMATAPILESEGWFRYCERASQGTLRYLCLNDDRNEFRALMPFHYFSAPPPLILRRPEFLIGAQNTLEHLYPAVVAVLDGVHLPVLGLTATDTDAIATLIESLLLASDQLGAKTISAPFMHREQDAAAAARILTPGRGPFVSAGISVLDSDWTGIDEYVASLATNRRRKVRRELRLFADSGSRVSVSEGTDALGEEAAALQAELQSRHGTTSTVGTLLGGYELLRQTVSANVVTFSSHLKDRLTGITVCIRDGDTLYVRAVGAPERDDNFTYFNVGFYAPIDWGCANGIARYVFGTGTYEAKRGRGCRVERTYGAVRWPRPHREDYDAQARGREREIEDRLR